MIVKTTFMLSLFLIPLVLINSGLIVTLPGLCAMYALSGLGMAGIGMGVMHDAIHGSYSKNRTVNKFLGQTMNFIGANATVWKIQHNVLHHTFTNIESSDDDINAPFFLRFSPHAKKYWLHRFQYIYVWFFYGLSTISWITTKDFVRLTRYKKMGFVSKKHEYRNELMKMIAWKVFYYGYALVLPLIMVPLAWWVIVLAFVGMHFITGLCISMVFQTAHIMPDSTFPLPDENGLIANDWTIHQLATTSNYSSRSRIFSWLIGGLNYQIEHHLLPNISHVHYRKISRIVKATAKEYGITYHTKKTFIHALWDHLKMIRTLGRMEIAPVRSTTK